MKHWSRHCSIVVNEYLVEHDVKPQPEMSVFIPPTCVEPLGQVNAETNKTRGWTCGIEKKLTKKNSQTKLVSDTILIGSEKYLWWTHKKKKSEINFESEDGAKWKVSRKTLAENSVSKNGRKQNICLSWAI